MTGPRSYPAAWAAAMICADYRPPRTPREMSPMVGEPARR